MAVDREIVYSGQTIDELISLESDFDAFEILFALETELSKKAAVKDVTTAEAYVLAIQALRREVDNGGYDQFFVNSSVEFAPIVVAALKAIGCDRIAEVTSRAISALGTTNPDSIAEIIADEDAERETVFAACDDAFYELAGFAHESDLEAKLLAFVKANREWMDPRPADLNAP